MLSRWIFFPPCIQVFSHTYFSVTVSPPDLTCIQDSPECIFFIQHTLYLALSSHVSLKFSLSYPLYLFISLYPSILLTISTFLPSSTTQTPSLNIVPLKHSCVVSSRNTARQKSVISHLSSGDRKHR